MGMDSMIGEMSPVLYSTMKGLKSIYKTTTHGGNWTQELLVVKPLITIARLDFSKKKNIGKVS